MVLSSASVKRPVAMGSLIIALVLLGLNSWRNMSLELMPAMDVPFITVVTIYPGASPEEIEVEVAKRIEDAVGEIDGLKHITSTCMPNVHQALLEFVLGTDVDIAATQVTRRIDTILQDLPADVEKPEVETFDINAAPVLTLALTGDAPLDELYDYADNQMSDRLTVIPGVANIELTGGAKREVHVTLDREALAARGLTSLDIVRAVSQGLGKLPAGNLQGGGIEYSVKYDADFENISAMGDLELVSIEGRRCYLRDVATVTMGTEELRKSAAIDGKPAVAIKVVKKSDANAVKVVDQVRAALDRLEETVPGGMQLVWVSDDATFIRALQRQRPGSTSDRASFSPPSSSSSSSTTSAPSSSSRSRCRSPSSSASSSWTSSDTASIPPRSSPWACPSESSSPNSHRRPRVHRQAPRPLRRSQGGRMPRRLRGPSSPSSPAPAPTWSCSSH